MSIPRRRDGLERREALLDAALRCFAERGVLGTGIEDIRREAGASPSSVYHLFDGLEGLTFELLTRTFSQLFAHLALRVTRTRSAEGAVHALVDGHLEWVLVHRVEAAFFYEAMALAHEPAALAKLQRHKADALAPVVEHLARFIEQGSLPAWPVLTFEIVLLGASHEACRRLLAGVELDPVWMRKELPRLAWRSLPK